MRITNIMTTNKTYNNITKNKGIVDKYYNQLATGKKIQYASENPILASRVLKFRTTLAEAEQYRRNVVQGYSWLEISELAVSSTQDIMNRVRDLAEQGANDTYDIEDRKAIVTDIKNLVAEVGMQMNQTYGGRYVFSGYKTDTEPVFNETNEYHFEISQDFNYLDIEKFEVFSRTALDKLGGIDAIDTDNIWPDGVDATNATRVFDATRIKLPYKNLENGVKLTFEPPKPEIPATSVSLNDVGAYEPAAGAVHYIKETGELILGADVAKDITDNKLDFQVDYEKKGFVAGEINPKVYFTCKDITDTDPTHHKNYNMDNQTIEYEFGINIRISVNNLAKDMFTAEMYADLNEFCTFADNIQISNQRDLELFYAASPYELTGNELDAAVKKHLDEEIKEARAVTQSRFEALIGSVDKYMAEISKQRTDLGSRMNRLDLMNNRLGDDIVAYTDLLSENENADLMESVMYLNITEAVYQASLNTGARILQTSLLDFLR